jgi:Mg-chelatase subunit ChlD
MPLDTVLCLDTSGSMANRGIRELKRAATEFLDGIEETAKQSQLKVCKNWTAVCTLQ